jgi:tripartite-type tricarboxylate transporter receptor subunit TctC
VRLIVPSGAGGVTDILARHIAPKLGDVLGQQVVIDNRPGASGIVGSQIVAKSAQDGYTLLMAFPSHVTNPSLFPDIPYDTVKHFAPVTLVSAVAPVLIAGMQLPARNMTEFIALAKTRPGGLNHGAVGAGSMGSLGAGLLGEMAGFKFTQVMFKGSPQGMTAVVSGEIDFYMLGSAGSAVAQVKAGRLRALGVGAKQRIAPLPDVPPIADTRPGYEARGWNGILAPAGTPRAVIEKLNRELVRIIRSPDMNANAGGGLRMVGQSDGRDTHRNRARLHALGQQHRCRRDTARSKVPGAGAHHTITTARLQPFGHRGVSRETAAGGGCGAAGGWLPRGCHRSG